MVILGAVLLLSKFFGCRGVLASRTKFSGSYIKITYTRIDECNVSLVLFEMVIKKGEWVPSLQA